VQQLGHLVVLDQKGAAVERSHPEKASAPDRYRMPGAGPGHDGARGSGH
jgi:hypothetical protein